MAAATAKKKEPAEVFALPEGRLINHSLFERDAFGTEEGKEGKPAYKVELAFPKEGGALDPVFEKLLDFADAEHGAKAENDPKGTLNIDGGLLISGVLDGDKLAAKREAKGKAGDAYKGHWIIRAKTIYNRFGQDAEGGAAVYGPDVSPIEPVNKHEVYPGCYGCAGVTLNAYETEDKVRGETYPAISFYLSAFQKTRDGEKLVSQADHSNLFKPVGRATAAEGTAPARRSRKG